jgi:glyoxylase-like metal-dependent hydrolase (beta-lactamase superfamily II)
LSELQFQRNFECSYGAMEQVAPGIRRVTARNPSKFTFKGTGTYIIGEGKVAVIDAGPDLAEHVDALLAALEGEEITHQLITHTHSDHSPAARPVKERTGAPTYGFGPHGAGRFEIGASVEAGGDMDFVPDHQVRHGDIIEAGGFTIECVHTPGHTSNHICYALQEAGALFTGDHVMGWSTTVISPPDGDMAAYMDSLELLLSRGDGIYYPTHAGPITDPGPYVAALIQHRKDREIQIMDCLARGIGRIAHMVPEMYSGLDPQLITAAGRSVFSHIIAMTERGDITCDGAIDAGAEFRNTGS